MNTAQTENMITSKTNKSNRKLVKWIFVAIGFLLMIMVSGIFIATKNNQAEKRNDKFNSELQGILSKDVDPSTSISVSGSYGSLVTLTDLRNDPFENTSDKLLFQGIIMDVNQIFCLNYKDERMKLIEQYGQEDAYQKDQKFINSKTSNLTCKIQTKKNLYGYSYDENRETGITINGVSYKISDH